MNNSIEERLNKLRIERDNLEITLLGLDAFIERLEYELDLILARTEEE